MKQSLQLRMGQQLSMTPQLQQAIKLLQLSTLDLQQEIQQSLDSNIMLEVIEDEKISLHEQQVVEDKVDYCDEVTSKGSMDEMPHELVVDSSWEDTYESIQTGVQSLASDLPDFETQRSKDESLQEHLVWQMEMLPFTARDIEIAHSLIDSVGADGYLNTRVDDIYQGLAETVDELTLDEVYAVLHRIQRFDPVGVAAENIKDCLMIQLSAMSAETPFRKPALILVEKYLDVLAAQDRTKLLKRLGISEQGLTATIALIRSLEPRPGFMIEALTSDYVVPDLFVEKNAHGEWYVELNPEIAPKLRVNPIYSKMVKWGDNTQDNTRMREHLQEARWFIKSLHTRNETLLRVGRCIIQRQLAFLEHGDIAMKPLILKDIAEDLELHESTISRVTTQKYMRLPTGVFELKYFFSSHVATDTGGECSATAIRAFIKELVATENSQKPLSDKKIADLLEDKGIKVARRTVAKYREGLSIGSSSQRKRLF